MGKLAVIFGCIGPYFISGVKEVADDSVGINTIEGPIVNANVVQAKIERLSLKAAATFDVVKETVIKFSP